MSFKDTQSYKELRSDWRWIHEMDPEATAAADQWVKEHPEEWKELEHMPDSLTGNPAGELVSKYDELLIKVKTPLTEEEVEALIGIFPESTMYEVEWTLLHLVETYVKPELLSKYRNLISKCPSEEWRDTMKVRLDNWEKKNGRHI